MSNGPDSVLWEQEPHTGMKHEILRRYLSAWLPILGSWNKSVVIIDGFAGPGQYSNNEPGSPLIILDTILNHKFKERFPKILALFIEKDNMRATYLETLLEKRYPNSKKKAPYFELENGKIRFYVIKAEFKPILQGILNYLRSNFASMAPCFAFIDPFGPSGIPMKLISEFMEHPKSEVFINFAFDTVNRFLEVPEYVHVLDDLYGCLDWREIRSIPNTLKEERHQKLHGLYISQLSKMAKAKHTLSFVMKDKKNRAIYYLVFGTKHKEGLNQMKQAMWKVDPTGNFQFSDYTYNPDQLSFFPAEPDFDRLAELIWNQFKSQIVPFKEVESWVITNTVPFASNHVRRGLCILEDKEKLKKYEGMHLSGQGWTKGTPYTKKRNYPENKNIIIEFNED